MSSWYDNQPLLVRTGFSITRKQMKELLTADLWDAVRLWSDYKKFGLFHGEGPAGENAEYIMLIRAFESEYDEVVAEASRTESR